MNQDEYLQDVEKYKNNHNSHCVSPDCKLNTIFNKYKINPFMGKDMVTDDDLENFMTGLIVDSMDSLEVYNKIKKLVKKFINQQELVIKI